MKRTKEYRKPLKGGGCRMIPRAGNGRFARAVIDVDVCQWCRAINLPEQVNAGSERFPLLKAVRAEFCHSCGKALGKTVDGTDEADQSGRQ